MYFNESGAEQIVQGPQTDAAAGIPLTVGLVGGGYLVIFQNNDAAIPGDVIGRIYDADGNAKTAAFTIFDDYVNFAFPHNIDAIALPNGGFAIVSQHVDQEGSSVLTPPITSDIQLQYWSANGTATSAPIAVTPSGSAATTSVSEPELAIANGKLVVTWDGGATINTAVYDLQGNLVTPTFTVDGGLYDTRSPAVTALANGNFMEVWRENSADQGNIRAAIYTTAGVSIGGSFLVNTATTGIQAIPHAATLSNGNSIVTWVDYSGATVTIHGQLVSSSGALLGSELVLADTTVSSTQLGNVTDTNLNDYGLTALNGGGFAIAFNNNKDTGFVLAKEFNSTGVALGDATQISNTQGFFPQIDALTSSGFEVVWSNNQTQTIYAQRIADARTVFDGAGSTVLIANFNAANGWTSQLLTPRHMADMNGDGIKDIVGFSSSGVVVSYGAANGSYAAPVSVLGNFGANQGWTDDNRFHRAVADVNGDGRADIIGFGQAGTLVSIAQSDGTFSAAGVAAANFGAAQGWTNQDSYARLVGDVNGDGKADIVGFGQAGTLIALGNGNGTFGTAALLVNNFGQNQGWTSDNSFHRDLADINGDGKLDIVGFGTFGTNIAFGNGDGTFSDAKLTFPDFGTNQGWTNNDGFSRLVADVNGDGKADILGFTNGGVLVAFGNGDGTFQPVRSDVADFGRAQGYTSDNTFHRELADVNHDGQIDIVGFGSAGVLVGYNHASTVF